MLLALLSSWLHLLYAKTSVVTFNGRFILKVCLGNISVNTLGLLHSLALSVRGKEDEIHSTSSCLEHLLSLPHYLLWYTLTQFIFLRCLPVFCLSPVK